MRRLLVTAFGVSLGLAGLGGVATAQEKSVSGILTSADGSYVTSTSGLNPTANGEGGTIVYGDINTGPGTTTIAPPSVVQNGTSSEPAVVSAPEPAPAPVAETVVAEPVAAETAVATGTDLDADNFADELEWDLGLDPNNADTDGDGTADGDELNLYGTDPTVFDSDGDGVSDGEELFGILTDPLIWDDFSAQSSEAVAQDAAPAPEALPEAPVADSVAPLAQETTEDVRAIDGDAAAVGPGSASAAPGSVTRGSGSGMALLGPDGTYSVSEVAPPNVTVAGDTEVLAPPAAAPATTTSIAGCDSYATWYDAQVAYESAGLTDGDPAIVSALDPDYDGIACEEVM